MDDETRRYIDEAIKIATKTHRHDGVLTQNVYLNQIIDPNSGPAQLRWSENLAFGFSGFAAVTNGATPVNVFGAGGSSINFSIGAIFGVSLDTTAGTITIKNNGNTVSSFAKGTTAGLVVGPPSIANNCVGVRNSFTIESSSAGNMRIVFMIRYENNNICDN